MKVSRVEIVQIFRNSGLNDVMQTVEQEMPGKGTNVTGVSVWDRTIFGRVKTVAVHYTTNVEP